MNLVLSRNTVRKMIKATGTPDPKRRKRASKLDPYRPRIRELIEKYNLSSIRILEKIMKTGYDGEYTLLKAYCLELRMGRRIQEYISIKQNLENLKCI